MTESRRLREQFAERAISVRSMSSSLRWMTGLALVAIAAAAVLVGLRGTGLPAVPLGAGSGRSTMPALSFWASIVLTCLAWSYLLGGVLHTYRPVRVAAPAIFGFGVYEMLNIGLPVETWRMAPVYAFAVAVAAVSLLALRAKDQRLRLPMVPVLFVLALGFYLSFWWRLRPLGDERYYTLAVYHQLVQLSFALIPLVLVSGVDYTEWGDAVAGRVSELAGGALPVAAAAAAGGPLAYLLVSQGTTDLDRRVGMAAVFLAAAALVFAQARHSHARVPYVAIFGCAFALMGIVLGVVYSTSGQVGSPVGLKTLRSNAPRFQIAFPASWQEKKLPTRAIEAFLLSSPPEAAQFYVVYLPPALAKTAGDPRAGIFKGQVTASSREGPWLRERFRETDGNQGISWLRSTRGAKWLLAGVAAKSTFPLLGRTFDDIEASWTQRLTAPEPPATAPPRYTSTDRALEYAGLAWLGLAVVAALLLVFVRRRAAGSSAAGLCFVAVAGVYFALAELPTIGYTLFGASSREALPQLTLRGLAELAAMLTLVALLTRRGRRLAGELVALNLGLLAVYWIDRAISAGVSDAGRLSIVASMLVLVALLWEVVMSGESITNRHDRRFPRHARVLLYLGYIIGVAAAVTFFSSIRTSGGVSEPLFESENFSDTGLLFLGTALVVTLFGLRVRTVLTPLRESEDRGGGRLSSRPPAPDSAGALAGIGTHQRT